MSELINYPGSWNGLVPDSIRDVINGKATINTSIFSRLEILEHLAFPVYIGLDQLRVADVACGTGEGLILMALLYPQVNLVGYDLYPEAREQAQLYISELGVKNLEIVEELPSGQFDLILHSRPLQHVRDTPNWLKMVSGLLAPTGVILLSAVTDDIEPCSEDVGGLRSGELGREETERLFKALLSEPTGSGIGCWSGLSQYLEANGLPIYMGVHPANYQPKRYMVEEAWVPEWLDTLSLMEQGHLAERLGQFERHYVLCGKGQSNILPQIGDLQTEGLIPHLSPYAQVFPEEDRCQVGLAQRYMMFQPGIELEDISLPAELFPIIQKVDGILTLEQLHRNFLPMSWERFLSVIEAAVEVEIVYLHRKR